MNPNHSKLQGKSQRFMGRDRIKKPIKFGDLEETWKSGKG